MLLFCPRCDLQHVDLCDEPEHRTHECGFCGWRWRVCDVPTIGVRAIQTYDEHALSPRPFEAKTTGWKA